MNCVNAPWRSSQIDINAAAPKIIPYPRSVLFNHIFIMVPLKSLFRDFFFPNCNPIQSITLECWCALKQCRVFWPPGSLCTIERVFFFCPASRSSCCSLGVSRLCWECMLSITCFTLITVEYFYKREDRFQIIYCRKRTCGFALLPTFCTINCPEKLRNSRSPC